MVSYLPWLPTSWCVILAVYCYRQAKRVEHLSEITTNMAVKMARMVEEQTND